MLPTKRNDLRSQWEDAEVLVKSLCHPNAYSHPVTEIKLIETHISWVILTGRYAYKLKKPLNLGFLDYTTLARRRHFCHEELRLNRRLAPEIYLAVEPITGSYDKPLVGGTGEAIEFAVKMHQFPQDALLSQFITHNEFSPQLAEKIAHAVARFHDGIEKARNDSPYGTPEAVLAPMKQNFDTVRERLSEVVLIKPLEVLEKWTRYRYEALIDLLRQRKQSGFIRECHGDMHLGNIALIDGEVTIFDGIEFNAYIRWIDVISELAFLVMDLDDREVEDMAQRVLNRYLQDSGDYESLPLLRWYQVYRAMVRAKVTSIRASQAHLTAKERDKLLHLYTSYIRLAQRYTVKTQPALVITHGVSGSGKSTLCQNIAAEPGVIWIRSDIERKRLYGLNSLARTRSDLESGVYSIGASDRTYNRLLELARIIIQAGFKALVDATFLRASQRDHFRRLAENENVPFLILDIYASEMALQKRIQKRLDHGLDPSEAGLEVLEYQLKTSENLSLQELQNTLKIDSELEFPMDLIRVRLAG